MTARKPARRQAVRRIHVPIQQLPHAAGLPLPAYQTAGAAGLDLVAALPEQQPLVLAPGARALIPTGLRIALPHGHEAQVRPRSGLALKHGVTVLNSPGTIDADYRGEVQVVLVNLGQEPFAIRRGERIAQMVVQTVSQANLVVRTTLDETARGAGGFGSTGRKSTTGEPAAARSGGGTAAGTEIRADDPPSGAPAAKTRTRKAARKGTPPARR